MPPLWIGLPILAAIAIVISLLVIRWRARGAMRSSAESSARGLNGGGSVAPGRPLAAAEDSVRPHLAQGRGSNSVAQKAALSGRAVALSGHEIFDALWALAFEVAHLEPPDPTTYEAVASKVGVVLEAHATELRHAPRRPLLLPQLLRAMRNDEVSRRELSKIITRDPSLAGNLLKLANSPIYRLSDRPVESVDRAVALLGTDGIRSLVATALVQPVFNLSKQAFARFPEIVWEHTYRAATAAEAHAAIVEDADPFAAQLLGLTMGLGSIVVFRIGLEQCEALAVRPDPAVIAGLFAQYGAPVARRIAVSWELSDRIADALEDQSEPRVPGERTALGRSLYFGRLMGALAVLRHDQRIEDAAAKASILATGATAFQFESIWGRLTGRGRPRPRQPLPTQGSWRDIGRPGG